MNELVEGFQDLLILADRSITRIFSEPWPPAGHDFPNRTRIVNPAPPAVRPRQPRAEISAIKTRRTHTVTRTRITTKKIVSSSTRQRIITPPSSAPSKQTVKPTSSTSPSANPTKIHERSDPPRSPAINQPKPFSPVPRPNQPPTPRITADDIKIDIDRCDVLVVAIAEMEICKEIFAGWSAQLDLAEPRKKDPLEQAIVTQVHGLNNDANAALRASHSLLHNYRALINITEKRLRSISQSKTGGSLYHASSEYERLSTAIAWHSSALITRVKVIQERLRSLVSDIEKTKEQARKRALRRRIWRWLMRTFQAISVLISAGGAIYAIFHPLGLLDTAAISVASMLSGAVARLCEYAQKKYDETTFDEILVFMRDHVPESAKAAEIALTSFQACHRILQVELEIRQGKRIDWLSPREAKLAHPAWSRADAKLGAVAKYDSEVPPKQPLSSKVGAIVSNPSRDVKPVPKTPSK